MTTAHQAAGAAAHHLPPAQAAGLPATLPAMLLGALQRAVERLRSRRRLALIRATLAELDEATLRDVGLSRANAAAYWAESEARDRVLRSRSPWRRRGGGG